MENDESMDSELLNKYNQQQSSLVNDFLQAVESGMEWNEVKGILCEIKKLAQDAEAAQAHIHPPYSAGWRYHQRA